MRNALDILMPRPFKAISEHPDVVLAVFVAALVSMLILPLPTALLDGLLAINLAAAAVILVAILLSSNPLSVSTFPTLLLITTLFRLGLNVSTTRMILAKGDAGEVVQAFGRFVIQGDLVVGLVVFLIITLVQFLVIGKGAERVAEVGARFTLDAMPGKQMSIDAAVRSGALEEDEAQAKRAELARESQFYGAMDGAMKFVKGDAIAGLIITTLNLAAGLVLGVLRHGLGVGEAAEMYTLLTVGDGLVSQIPALLVTLSAGVLITRVAAADDRSDLGHSLQSELLSRPKVLVIGGAFGLGLGLVPGLPLFPFFMIASALFAIAFVRHRALTESNPLHVRDTQAQPMKAQIQAAKQKQALVDQMAPAVSPLSLDCDPELSALLQLDGPVCPLVDGILAELRDALFLETGVRFPGVVVRKNVGGLSAGMFVVRVKDVPVLKGEFPPGKVLVREPAARFVRLGVPVESAPAPWCDLGGSCVPEEFAQVLTASGVAVHDVSEAVALALMETMRKYATHFLGLQDVSELVERLAKVYPRLVEEVVPKLVSLSQLSDILRRLVDEQVCIRDLKTVLECLADTAQLGLDRVALTERVRGALYLQIGHQYAGLANSLKVVVLDPMVEDTIAAAIEQVPGGTHLNLDPAIRSAILASVKRVFTPLVEVGQRPVILTNPTIRRYLHKLISSRFPSIPVISFFEMPEQVVVQPLGQVTLEDELLEAG